MKSCVTIAHTADIGLKIKAGSLRKLFTASAEGFYGLMTDVRVLGRQRPEAAECRKVFSLREAGPEELLFSWLRELLYFFSAKRYVFLNYRIEKLNLKELKIRASGIRFDPQRHEQRHEVKAVTYHGFKLKRTRAGWAAEIIFDI